MLYSFNRFSFNNFFIHQVLNVMTERVDLPLDNVPSEMFPLIRAYQPSLKSKQEEYLPIVYVNELSQRIKDLVNK
jgi:hypothetical protein